MDGGPTLMVKKMKLARVIGLSALLLAVLGGVYFTTAGHAPPGQPPLVVVDSQTLSTLQAEFNRTADRIRVILLLSPT
jgi:hypothetical protein